MIVVFDGMCNVCNGYVRFLQRRDRRDRLTFVTAGSDEGRRLLVAYGEAPDAPSTMIVIERGIQRVRSDAVLAAIAALGGGWRGIGLLRIIPRAVRDALYTGFARRRYRWFGQAPTCATCDPGARTRSR